MCASRNETLTHRIFLKSQRERAKIFRAGSLKINLQKQINDTKNSFKAWGVFCPTLTSRFNGIQSKTLKV